MESLDGTNGFSMFGRETEDQFGQRVSGLGDINNDGFDDFSVTSFGGELLAGGGVNGNSRAVVVFGGETLGSGGVLDVDQLGGGGFVLPDFSSSVPVRVEPLGDVNGDNIDDFGISRRSSSF
ncbi:MAG: hypothetical protein AAGJ54_10775, partial [Planctomycetota bacterium]